MLGSNRHDSTKTQDNPMTETNELKRLNFLLGALISALDVLTPAERSRIISELQRKASRATHRQHLEWLKAAADAVAITDRADE